MDLHSNATHIVGGLRPPPGVTPNFVNPENLRTVWIVSLVACFFPPTFFIFIRVYTKLIIMKSHGWEDCKFCPHTGLDFDPVLTLDVDRHCLYRMGMSVSECGHIYSLDSRRRELEVDKFVFQDRLNRLSLYRLRRF